MRCEGTFIISDHFYHVLVRGDCRNDGLRNQSCHKVYCSCNPPINTYDRHTASILLDHKYPDRSENRHGQHWHTLHWHTLTQKRFRAQQYPDRVRSSNDIKAHCVFTRFILLKSSYDGRKEGKYKTNKGMPGHDRDPQNRDVVPAGYAHSDVHIQLYDGCSKPKKK